MPQHDKSSNGTTAVALNGVVRQQRHSLQSKPIERSPSNFRHTQSQRYDSETKKRTRKATVVPPIQTTISEGSENETEEKTEKNYEKPEKVTEQHVFTIENEKRNSKTSKKSEKINHAYDNIAYDTNLDKRSISSRAGSSRQPSVQSLEVVREQYCCCAKRTKCEKKLLLTVTILSTVIIVLVIVLAIVASNRNIGENLKKTLVSSFHK